jgi:hypothetical protein
LTGPRVRETLETPASLVREVAMRSRAILIGVALGALAGGSLPAGAAPVDVTVIDILVFKGHSENVFEDYEVELFTCGNGIDGVNVTPPIGPDVSLVETFPGCWSTGSFPTASSGSYTFEYQGSPGDTATVIFSESEPSGFAFVTVPMPGEELVTLEPEFEWDDVTSYANGDIEVYLDGDDGRDEEPWAVLPLAATSWDPWPDVPTELELQWGGSYSLSVTIFNAETQSNEQTTELDDFVYVREFASINEVSFPEPRRGWMLAVGVAAIVLLSRRRNRQSRSAASFR